MRHVWQSALITPWDVAYDGRNRSIRGGQEEIKSQIADEAVQDGDFHSCSPSVDMSGALTPTEVPILSTGYKETHGESCYI